MGNFVDLEWYGDPPIFYCPVCGTAIITEDGPGDNWCSHFKFLYHYGEGDFMFNDEHYENLLTDEDYEECEEKDIDIVEKLMEKVDSKSAVAMNLTTTGMACGPVSMTVAFGVDFDPKK